MISSPCNDASAISGSRLVLERCGIAASMTSCSPVTTKRAHAVNVCPSKVSHNPSRSSQDSGYLNQSKRVLHGQTLLFHICSVARASGSRHAVSGVPRRCTIPAREFAAVRVQRRVLVEPAHDLVALAAPLTRRHHRGRVLGPHPEHHLRRRRQVDALRPLRLRQHPRALRPARV